MKRLVERGDIVDYATYEDTRASTRPVAMAAKAVRRVHLNDHLTLLFENSTTLRYQIQEIMRVERIVREADIEYEIAMYNGLLGEPGDLGCVLLIGIENAADRGRLLTEWRGLQARIYVKLADGERIYATSDPSQIGHGRLSAVQYLVFAVGGEPPVAVGSDFHGLESEQALATEQLAALTEDLRRQ